MWKILVIWISRYYSVPRQVCLYTYIYPCKFADKIDSWESQAEMAQRNGEIDHFTDEDHPQLGLFKVFSISLLCKWSPITRTYLFNLCAAMNNPQEHIFHSVFMQYFRKKLQNPEIVSWVSSSCQDLEFIMLACWGLIGILQRSYFQ